MTIFQTLQGTGLPCRYSHFKQGETIPPRYIVYLGSGQASLAADDTKIWTRNEYQVEYYYADKDEAAEAAIESALLAAGYMYEKSGDVYIENEGVFVIYYSVY